MNGAARRGSPGSLSVHAEGPAVTREHPAAGAGPACARQGERVELAFAGMRANIRRDLRHARLSRTDLGRGGTHVPAFGIITDGLPEDQPSQVKRRSDVDRGDRHHDDHPDVIAATADLGVDTRAYNRRAFLLGKAAAEITADGSPRREATGPRYVQAHGVPVAGRVIVQVVEAAAWLDRWLPSLLGQERVREHREGDVPVPGLVEPDLVVVQAGLVLGLGEAVLNRPPVMPLKRKLSLV